MPGKRNTVTFSIWKAPDGYSARLDVSGQDSMTKYLPTFKSRDEVIRHATPIVAKLGVDASGMSNARTKLSIHAWRGMSQLDMMSDPDYNPDDHLVQAQFVDRMRKLQQQAQRDIDALLPKPPVEKDPEPPDPADWWKESKEPLSAELDSLIREFSDHLEVSVSPHGDQLHLMSLQARTDAPPGTGSLFMSKLSDLADRHRLILTLNTASKGDRYSDVRRPKLKFKQTTSADRLKRFYGRFGFKSNYGSRTYRSDLPGNMHRLPKASKGESRARSLITWMTEGTREERVQAEMDRMVDEAPGADRGEKLSWVWKNRPAFGKLYKSLMVLYNYERPKPKPYNKDVIRYYVRFADRPPEPGFKSSVWYRGKPVRRENGISAYSARWNRQYGAWELERGDGMASGPEDSIEDVVSGRLKAWLIMGPETGETGSDTEPLLNGADVKVVKQLTPLEIVVPGYYSPEDLDPEYVASISSPPFSRIPR